MDIVDELKDSYSFLGDPLHRKAWEEIEKLRDALHDIQDMPDDWENDDELNLYFVVDNHIFIATEALKGKSNNATD